AVCRGGHGYRPIGGYLTIEYGHGSPEAEHPPGLPEDVFRTIEHLAEGAGDMLRRHTRAVVNYSEAVWFWIRKVGVRPLRDYSDVDIGEGPCHLRGVQGILNQLPHGHVESSGRVGKAGEIPVAVEKF